MKTVPLHGKLARGRVALVDDEDYDLVMQYRWYVIESLPEGRRPCGPYAATRKGPKGGGHTTRMHCLIMGAKGIDHRDHNGLNNQRYNLRLATHTQNMRNMRSHQGTASSYKGVSWHSEKCKWRAGIKLNNRTRHLGYFFSEAEAAYAYDAAAREHFGEFACVNFPGPPTQAMRDEWRTTRVTLVAERISRRNAEHAEWWTRREAEARVCTVCGNDYETRASGPTLYCGNRCRHRARALRTRECELEGRLF